MFQTAEHRMTPEDRAKRDAEETLKQQKADLMKREFRIQIAGERIPRILSLASYFPEGDQNGN